MNEKEIITYLKENRNEGIAFDFMPEEVREWCITHHNEPIFNIYYSDGWSNTTTVINCYYSGIYALPDDYELKPEFEQHWEEFEIDDKGWFTVVDDDDSMKVYKWWDWQAFLGTNNKYNAFGGWLFDDHQRGPEWSTYPKIRDADFITGSRSSVIDDKTSPAFPAKIRFWRYIE